MRVVRRAYCYTTELYELEIDERYLSDLNKHLQEHTLVTPDASIVITEDTIRQAMNGDYDEDIKIITKGWNGEAREESLFDLVNDWINDDLWDSYIEVIDSETNDYETDIED